MIGLNEDRHAHSIKSLLQTLCGIMICSFLTFAEAGAMFESSQNTAKQSTQFLLEEDLVVIKVTTDEFGSETKWSLINANDYTVLFSSDNLSVVPHSDYIDSIKVNPNTCLRFVIEDRKEDGLSGEGKFEVYFNENLVVENVVFSNRYEPTFNCKEGQVCEEAIRILQGSELLKVAENNWFVIRPIFDTYFSIRTISNCDTKLWLYDACDKVHPTNQTGSILFNDDFADKQAGFAQVFLEAGKYYYLRVGNEADCIENSFVEIVDLKLKKGCMDPSSCNFDPTANLDSGDCVYADCQPDVIVDEQILLESIYLDSIVNDSECLIEEGCLQGYGKRDIIRFTTQIENIGDADYIIGEAEENSALFSEDNCHQHWHYLGYAEYLIFDGDGSPQPVGFKNGFCALDYRCKEDEDYKYSCDYMGISAGCYDTYDHDLLCQWIDVTDLPEGDYSLVVRVNYNRSPDIFGREESNYENNWAQVCVNLDRTGGRLNLTILEDCPAYEDCMGIQNGRARVDCEGICGGSSHFGDLNSDGNVDDRDIEQYKSKMKDLSMIVTPCLDLDADGDIGIYDLVLLEDCVANNNTNEADPLHTHCDFPKSVWNDSDSIYLELTDYNTDEKYISLSYSSSTDILALDMNFDGLMLDYIVSENDDIFITSLSSNNHVSLIVEKEDLGFEKTVDLSPLIRIYYKEIIENSVCISNVLTAVNLQKEKIRSDFSTNCLSFQTTALDEVSELVSVILYPNPTVDVLRVVGIGQSKLESYFISNQYGLIVENGQFKKREKLSLDVSTFDAGVYFLNVIGDSDSYICRFVKM